MSVFDQATKGIQQELCLECKQPSYVPDKWTGYFVCSIVDGKLTRKVWCYPCAEKLGVVRKDLE